MNASDTPKTAIEDALTCDPSLFISCIPTPPFDRARIKENWTALVSECKRLQSVERELAAMTAERDALLKAQAWMPIETAPKDGAPFLAYDAKNEHPIMVHADYGKGSVMLGDECNYISEPTHWMPLPKPPKESVMS